MYSRRNHSLHSIRSHARFLKASFIINLKAAAEYRGNFLIQVFGMILNNAAFLVFWQIFLLRTGDLAGYGMQEILFLWGLTSAAFGLSHIVAGNTRSMGRIIMNGELDVYLLQPKDVMLNLICSRSVLSAWGDLLFGAAVLFWISWSNPLRLLFCLVFVFSGALIYTSIFAVVETLTFYLGSAGGGISRSMTELMITASLYPESIFGPGMRWLLYSAIPTGFIVFIPLRSFLQLSWPLLLVSIPAALAYWLSARLFFRLALKKYESGNLVGARV
ncbi:ABC transporter permease [Spirochaeta dissipatitropha]